MWNPLRQQERRLAPRRAPKSSTNAGLFAAAPLMDLSERGARLCLGEALPIGKTVQLYLASVEIGPPVLVPAVVVWSAPVGDGTFWVGLRFEQQLPSVLVQKLTTD